MHQAQDQKRDLSNRQQLSTTVLRPPSPTALTLLRVVDAGFEQTTKELDDDSRGERGEVLLKDEKHDTVWVTQQASAEMLSEITNGETSAAGDMSMFAIILTPMVTDLEWLNLNVRQY